MSTEPVDILEPVDMFIITKKLIYQEIIENISKSNQEIFDILMKRFPNTPLFVIQSCLEELSEE